MNFGNKKQFEENIYWNRNKEGDIAIRAELINQDSGESIFLARVATIADLSNPDNNAPDNFSIFKLYEISSIDSDKFGESLDSKALESILGENFLKNFSLLNYLEQGQNILFKRKLPEFIFPARHSNYQFLINLLCS